MTHAVQILSCIIDMVLIITMLHFIVDDSFHIRNRWAIIATLVCCFIGFTFVGNRYADFDTTMMVIRFALPLIIYIAFGSGSLIKRFVKYLLALLFFSSAEIVSIFIEMLVILEPSGEITNGLFFSLISIIVNIVAIFFIHHFFWRQKMKVTFSGNEWALLLLANVVTFMLLVAVGYIRQIPFVDMIPQEFLQIVIKYSVIFLYLFFVISLINGKVADHFKAVGQVTQESMEQQLEYFKAYKNSQEEIRRYKHDMKNHFLYLNSLSQDNKIEEMKEYINSLSEHWENIPQLNGTGNTVIDAIIYGKSFLFEQNHIALTIEGQFTSNLDVEPIDLCTIFTNAIDNAIEANVKCPATKDRYLKIIIKGNQHHYLIIFKNPTNNTVKITDNRIKTDKQEENHGFGLKNIERALLKYNGTFKISTSPDNVFILEAVMPKQEVVK